MKHNGTGFTLLELIIVIVLLGIITAMSMSPLQALIRGSSQQSGIVSSQFEMSIGLELLRGTIEGAGLGLPDSAPSLVYQEASASPQDQFNDASGADKTPRAIIIGNNLSLGGTYVANSDYLVIKSVSAADNKVAGKWSYVTFEDKRPHIWDDATFNMTNGDRMVLVRPRRVPDVPSTYVTNGTTFADQYNDNPAQLLDDAFQPKQTGEAFFVYGIDDSALRMPFNRADFYVRTPVGSMPPHCAPGTGILYKATINHSGGGNTEMPLVNCVANMQVIIRLDTDGDRTVDQDVATLGLTALGIKQQVKEVRVYILAHEGREDPSYQYPLANQIINVGEFGLHRAVDLSTLAGLNWRNYRWKIYTLVVKPRALF